MANELLVVDLLWQAGNLLCFFFNEPSNKFISNNELRITKTFLELEGNDQLFEVTGLLDDDMRVYVDGKKEESFFPVIDFWKFENKFVKLRKGGLETRRDMPKKRDYDKGIVDKRFWPDLGKIATIVFIEPRGLLKLKRSIFNLNFFLVLVDLTAEVLYIAKVVKVD